MGLLPHSAHRRLLGLNFEMQARKDVFDFFMCCNHGLKFPNFEKVVLDVFLGIKSWS
jgi:hypothetical protein